MNGFKDKPRSIFLYGGIVIMALFTAGILFYFIYVTTISLKLLQTLPAHIPFDKGAFYLFGAGIGLSAILFSGIYEYCLGRSMTKKMAGVITKVILSGLLMMFLLPHITHYLIAAYMNSKGYQVCHEASRQWLHSKTIVFVSNRNECQAIIQEKNNIR